MFILAFLSFFSDQVRETWQSHMNILLYQNSLVLQTGTQTQIKSNIQVALEVVCFVVKPTLMATDGS